ncbi:hypothetical protein AVEN_275578-1 [Araneus ventricosus]|uniref:STPR domain-containing protein n=1 Tax=Araneus ventricosus TaxID=182803 RepID=A0A4Y2Q7V1_ARAVE|nr:hypothetical protein AVEN_275578-1 [Araneus ventricosus]
MLPVDSRQLENVKGELLKLTKKETMAQRGRDRRAEETEEQNNSRLSDMAQRDHERTAEETEEQRNSRLSAMVQHAKERRLNVIKGQNHHQIQTFMQLELYFTPYSFKRECRAYVTLRHFFSPPGNDKLFDIDRATPGHTASLIFLSDIRIFSCFMLHLTASNRISILY